MFLNSGKVKIAAAYKLEQSAIKIKTKQMKIYCYVRCTEMKQTPVAFSTFFFSPKTDINHTVAQQRKNAEASTDQLVVVELRPLLVHGEPPGRSTHRRAADVDCKHESTV